MPKKIKFTREHRHWLRGETVSVPDQISEKVAEDLVKLHYADWVEVAVAKRKKVERATARHTR